jgi:FkbM family methyltransferase
VKISDDRGLGKQIKRLLPQRIFRALTIVFNLLTWPLPLKLKYGLGQHLRKRKAPYCWLMPGDTVVQVGCARDILLTGRSRAIHFAMRVPRGRVILVEADAANCGALRDVLERLGIHNVSVVELGAWEHRTTLAFLSSRNHPAANVLVEAKEIDEDLVRRRKYETHLITVDSLDNILTREDCGTPALVSITTNGAELQILRGMKRTLADARPVISLASTGPGFNETMQSLGYEYIARDDRGYCFRPVVEQRGALPLAAARQVAALKKAS